MGTLEDNAVVRALGTVERELNRTFDSYSIVQKRKKQYSKERLKMPLSAMELHEMNGMPVYVGAPFNYWAIVDAKGDTEKNKVVSAIVKIEGKLARLIPAPSLYLVPNKEDKWSGSIEFVKPEGGEKE